jgi:hypothetical protein
MSPEARRIAIAEACGLFRIMPLRRTTRKGMPDPNGVVLWYCSEHHGGAATYEPVPDYLTDLNAMREAEKVLTPIQQGTFCCHLYGGRQEIDLDDMWVCAHATAAQRAEAFLRTLNLWDDTK